MATSGGTEDNPECKAKGSISLANKYGNKELNGNQSINFLTDIDPQLHTLLEREKSMLSQQGFYSTSTPGKPPDQGSMPLSHNSCIPKEREEDSNSSSIVNRLIE